MNHEKLFLKTVTVKEALNAALEYPGNFRYIAGGTDVIVNKMQGNDESGCLIDLTGINELQQVTDTETEVRIGSMVRIDELKNYPVINHEFPALLEAAHSVASPVLRKTATLGGNILCENRCTFYNQSAWWREAIGYCLKCDGDVCIATGGKKACFSKFVSDTAPVLISMMARIEVACHNGLFVAPLESIYTGNGIEPRNLSKESLIISVILPKHNIVKTIFKKLRPREAVDFTSLTTAVTLFKGGRIRIVLGGVDPMPVVVDGFISDDYASLINLAVKKSRIVDNDFYSRAYRKEMISVFLASSLEEFKVV